MLQLCEALQSADGRARRTLSLRTLSYLNERETDLGLWYGKAAWSVVWAGTFTIGAERGAGAVAAGVNMLEAQETVRDE